MKDTKPTNHEKLKSLLKSEGLNYHDIAKITGHSYGSVKNMLQPNKPVPRWLKLLIYIHKPKECDECEDGLKWSPYYAKYVQCDCKEQ